MTESPGENIVIGQINGNSFDNNAPCRIWTQIFDCKDGSFIVRYKVFNTCSNINIKVKIKGKELSLPHSKLKGMYDIYLYFFLYKIFLSSLFVNHYIK